MADENRPIRRITMAMYKMEPSRYNLLSGDQPNAPTCPYGNSYQWIGYDKQSKEFVRFTKSVFKVLVNN